MILTRKILMTMPALINLHKYKGISPAFIGSLANVNIFIFHCLEHFFKIVPPDAFKLGLIQTFADNGAGKQTAREFLISPRRPR